MPSSTVSGSSSACLISAARFLTLSCRAICSRAAASIEIGNAAARTSRSPTRTVAPRVARPAARRQARRKFVASARRWKPSRSAPSSPLTTWRRQGSWAKIS